MELIRTIWNYPIAPPLPWPYAVILLGVILLIALVLMRRILK